MVKYAVGIVVCLGLLGVGIWGSVTCYPDTGSRTGSATAVQSPAGTQVGPQEPVATAGPVVAEDSTVVIRPSPVSGTDSLPSGAGVVRASFTVVG